MKRAAMQVGEPVAVDLVNTRPEVKGRQIDLIATSEDFRFWLGLQQERVPTWVLECAAFLGDNDLEPLFQVREALDLLLAPEGTNDAGLSVDTLNASMRTAPITEKLVIGADSQVFDERRGGAAPEAVAGYFARIGAVLISDKPTLDRCAADGCRMIFAKSQSARLWCSSAACGNRVRVARYRRRVAQQL